MTDVVELPAELLRAIASLGGRKLVLVEGSSDRDVLYRWFLERAPDVVFFDAGGYKSVVTIAARIYESRPDVQVYGIRDRDFLSNEEVEAPLLDPAAYLFIWRRYSIENYLLEPAALFPEIEAFLGDKCPVSNVPAMEAKLLALCADLHCMMSANSLLLEHDQSRYSDGHHLLPRADFVQVIAVRLSKSAIEADAILREREDRLAPKLASLDAAHTVTSGKHLLHQIYDFVASIQRGLRKDHLFRLLRNRIKERVGIHSDIREIVERRILGDA